MSDKETERGGQMLAASGLLGRAWDILKTRGPMRGSDLGWELWGKTTEVPTRGTGSHQHNKFCRPAGKVLKRLQRLGCVREIPKETYMAWDATGNRPDEKLRHAGPMTPDLAESVIRRCLE